MKSLKYAIYIIISLILLLFIIGKTQIGNQSKPKSLKGDFLSINGARIRYFQKGSGKDILMIHGTPGSLEDWDFLIDSLAKDYRVTVFDRLGHGYSSSVHYNYHLCENVDLVNKLIDSLHLKNPLLVGHSYGGSTLVNYAVRHANNKKLQMIIIDPPLYTYKAKNSIKLVALPLIGKGIACLANSTIAPKQIKTGLQHAFINQSPEMLDKLIQQRKEIWLQPKVLYSKSKESVNYQEDLYQIRTHYKEIETAITIITGADKSTTFREDCERFQKETKNSQLYIIENTAHYIQFDQPEVVLKLIRSKVK